VLLAILKRGATEQEIIYILEKFTWGEMEGKEIPSQSLAKEVATVRNPRGRTVQVNCWEV
jgi:hypothetical protein